MAQKIGDLRGKVQNLIEASKDPGDAAALICLFFEDEIGLAGNGWFDDDSLLGFDKEDDEKDESNEVQSEHKEDNFYDYDALYERMKRLQFSPFDMNWADQVGRWLQGSDDPEVVQKLTATARKDYSRLSDITDSDIQLMIPQLWAIFDGVIVGTPESVSFLYQCIDAIAANGERGNVETLPAIAKARLGVAS